MLATTFHYQPRPTEPTADVRFIARSDVTWDRPIFKAPPLELDARLVDSEHFKRDLRAVGFAGR